MGYIKRINREELSPMMQQWYDIKADNEDCLVFYRLGDFYEMFFDDAIEASQDLELTLTARDCGNGARAPMCGVPFHAVDAYIAKLISMNKKVAIVEQLEDPAKAKTIVERGIIRIVTPGTVIESECLTEDKNNYILSITTSKNKVGVCWADISTGAMETTEFVGDKAFNLLDSLLSRLLPSEIIIPQYIVDLESKLNFAKHPDFVGFTHLSDADFAMKNATALIKEQFGSSNLVSLDLNGKNEAISAVGGMLTYLKLTQRKLLGNINHLFVVYDKDYLQLDYNARRNLELVESMVTGNKKGSLLGVLDQTKTSMGARKIRNLLENPLLNDKKINDRLDAVAELYSDVALRENINEKLYRLSDIERISSRIATRTITPKDCYLLGKSLNELPGIKKDLMMVNSSLLKEILCGLADFEDLSGYLLKGFDIHSPVNYKDGNFLLDGFNDELDKTRHIAQTGYDWVTAFTQSEKERTGIKNLRVSYNKVFGYYIEVTKSNLKLVPSNYQLRQSTINAEKYITDELKEAERMILTGSEQALELEMALFEQVRDKLYQNIDAILLAANSIALLDALISFAQVSAKNNYVRPEINADIDKIEIIGGRHPVVESMLGANKFTDNDTLLDGNENNILIITGPNMGGKSTYMRQVALITIMAHIGCFVPAKSAKISLTDRIFTRIGASDELAFGNSTFMVEMMEVSNIINNATSKSLLILDEVGRGTSTFDGLSIAWAIIEHLSANVKAKTLFATHYHELIALENKIVGIKNYRVLVKELNNTIVFLHKIARGSANRSFGIEVASLAGLPDDLINRAKEILSAEEKASGKIQISDANNVEIPKIDPNAIEVINVLREMDLNTISPLMAFGTLQNLVDKVKKN